MEQSEMLLKHDGFLPLDTLGKREEEDEEKSVDASERYSLGVKLPYGPVCLSVGLYDY